MAVTTTYPGVYIQELPSGARAIAGVSTSIGAFVGKARRGPINRAVRCQGWADYERSFGGLVAGSDMSYGVRQFFLNGGSECHVVRLAKTPVAASATAQIGPGVDSLVLTALDAGRAGNDVTWSIDHATANPASTFNLFLSYTPADGSGETINEAFPDLSLNSNDTRWAVSVVNGTSRLVSIQRVAAMGGLLVGRSISGDLATPAGLVDLGHRRLQVQVNGNEPVAIELDPLPIDAAVGTPAKLAAIAAQIQNRLFTVGTQRSIPAITLSTCDVVGTTLRLTSGVAGEASTVRVLPGLGLNAAGRLRLGSDNGGIETDAVAAIRPAVTPLPGRWTSGVIPNVGALAGIADPFTFRIAIDGKAEAEVSIGPIPAAGTLVQRLEAIAALITPAVRALKPSFPGYAGFTATVINDGGQRLRLRAGSTGDGSSVVVTLPASNHLRLAVADGAVRVDSADNHLTGGDEQDFIAAETYMVYAGNRGLGTGMYALERVDMFNLLCLPGVSDVGMLDEAAAYCVERRAFLIADPPANIDTPALMEAYAGGIGLPKNDHAATYWPWVEVGDPLRPGKTRRCGPSGTVAGLFARTDSSRGVWKAPAGQEATLVNVQGFSYLATDRENGILNPLGVNVLRMFPSTGPVCWGTRTLRGGDQLASEWKYVPVRRLALYLEESLYRGLKWAVFEPNGEALWSQIRMAAGSFMNDLHKQGAFAGTTPRDSYFVKCDSETTSPADRALGRVNIHIGFAPLRPAEFVILYLQQMASQAEA